MTKIFILLLGISVLIAIFARRRSRGVLLRCREVEVRGAVTGGEAARRLLDGAGATDVNVIEYRGMLPDYYDAGKRCLFLREENYHGTYAAAVGIATHEAAHALQHVDAFTPLTGRLSALKLSLIGGGALLLLVVAGACFRVLSARVGLGILGGGWAVMTLFNLLTYPVEMDATKRAVRGLTDLGITGDRDGAKAVARAAGAAGFASLGVLLSSVPYLVYHLVPFFGRRWKKS